MDCYYTTTSLLLLIPLISLPILLLHFFKRSPKSTNNTKLKLPPGPKPWPIIGNIHLLGVKPHISVSKLSQTHGPIMTLKLGKVTTIVISSPQIAKEMFLKHDSDFSSRKLPESRKISNHNKTSIVWLPVCPKWRHLKKVATVHLFTNKTLDATQALRQTKVNELVSYVRRCADHGLAVDVGDVGFTTLLNLLTNTFFSIDFAELGSSESHDFRENIRHLLEEGARPNVSDFFPLVKLLDLQGVSRRAAGYFGKMYEGFAKIVDGRFSGLLDAKDDVINGWLKLVEKDELSTHDIKHILMDLFIGGTDTVPSTIEWAMTELLCNPQKLAKAQSEIDLIVGENGTVQESDITKASYIQAVVKETLRLHPPTPFLLPRKTDEDVQLCRYFVPKDSQVWVNVWSMGRDPKVWPEPSSFSPERFMNDDQIDMNGRDFRLIPFGAGRRTCPGMPLAYKMMHLMLATLVHAFDWKLAHGLSPQDIDMDESFGLTLQKAQPLLAVPIIR